MEVFAHSSARASDMPSHGRRHGGLIRGFFVLLASLTLAAACKTKAVGIEECREIESARCEASVACGIVEEDELDSCVRFYEDQCLHGFSGDKSPTADQQKKCVELIEDAGQRALAAQGMGGEAAYEDACDIIAAPWDYPECAYVIEEDSMGGADGE